MERLFVQCRPNVESHKARIIGQQGGGLLLMETVRKAVYCEKCSDIVQNSSDLIMILGFLRIRTYHKKCYVDVLQGRGGYAISGHPLNSRATLVESAFLLVFCVAIGIIANQWWFLLLAVIMPAMRMWAWLRYERHFTS